jgi:hypothetical protein
MQVSRWLRIAIIVVGFNAAVVVWSVVQRHVWASTSEQESESQTGSEEQASQDLRSSASTVLPGETELPTPMKSPKISELPVRPVPADDPLLQEIRKHAASQFPELTISADPTQVLTDPSPSGLEGREVAELELHQQRLRVVGKLNEACMLLVQTSAYQRQRGRDSQAAQSLSQAQQLKSLMVQLLAE